MRVKRVATLINDVLTVCRVLEECEDGTLRLLQLDNLLNKVCLEPFCKPVEECVKVVLFKSGDVVVNFDKELQRAALALGDQKKTLKKRKRSGSEKESSSDDVFSGTSPSSCSTSSLEKRRMYSPSVKGQHDAVKQSHNLALCKQYNEMMRYYEKYDQSTSYALFLDSPQLATESALIKHCLFQPKNCLVPNPYEYDALHSKKAAGLYQMSLGSFLKRQPPAGRVITFAWFDYMNSLDGNVQDSKAGESSPREDIEEYLTKWAKPYTLFAVTLCLRHSKYKTHDYNGGTEVVIMRYVNDKAREAGFYFSIVPPTCTYGSSMFIYAGVLLPLVLPHNE